MKFTVFRTKKDNSGFAYLALCFNSLRDNILHNSYVELIGEYGEMFLALEHPETWCKHKSIPHVCAATEYYRNKADEHIFRAYNGVVTLVIERLNAPTESEKAKNSPHVIVI